MSRAAPTIPHTLFFDNSIMFAEAKPLVTISLKNALGEYAEASDQLINPKSIVAFSPNTNFQTTRIIHDILGVPMVSCHTSYLGLPAIGLRNKKSHFSGVKNRTVKKLSVSMENNFSFSA